MLNWRQLQKWQNDWLTVNKKAIERRQAFLGGLLYDDRARLTRAVEDVRDGRNRLAERFAYGFRDELEIDSSVATTPHMERLLVLAQKTDGTGFQNNHRWFDAISLFDQAIALSTIERQDPLEGVGRDMDRFIDRLTDLLFVGGFETVEFYVYHDPTDNAYIVTPEDVGIGRHLSHRAEGRIRRMCRLTCRRTQQHGLVFLHHRIKTHFHVWLKQQRQVREGKTKRPFEVMDRCGLMMVAENRERAVDLAQQVQKLFCQDGAIVTEGLTSNFAHDAGVDASNTESDHRHKFAKCTLRWGGRTFELQFLGFNDYFNATRSLISANHELYKLRQALRHFFPLLWPVEIYNVQWDNPRTRSVMRTWQIAKLGWRVNGNL